jgi:hypothetical protein
MARPKRPPHPMLKVAREHLCAIEPRLKDAPLSMRTLDGPPGSPRYAIWVTACTRSGPCPHGFTNEQGCSVHYCPLRDSFRMLFTREGQLVELIRDGVRWSN